MHKPSHHISAQEGEKELKKKKRKVKEENVLVDMSCCKTNERISYFFTRKKIYIHALHLTLLTYMLRRIFIIRYFGSYKKPGFLLHPRSERSMQTRFKLLIEKYSRYAYKKGGIVNQSKILREEIHREIRRMKTNGKEIGAEQSVRNVLALTYSRCICW